MSVAKHFVKILFPIQYEYDKEKKINLDEIMVSQNGKKAHKLFQKIGFENVELRKGLSDLFSKEDNKSRIMYGYRVDRNVHQYLSLPRRISDTIQFYCRSKNRVEPYQVKIADISLYLFESGVGFIEAEFEHQNNNVEELIACNYFMSEIGDNNNYFVASQQIWREEKKTKEKIEIRFTLKELLEKVLVHIPGVTDFYSGKEWETAYKKGIVYSYILMDAKPENFEELLFNMKQNYKSSYKAPKRYVELQDDPTVLQQFENSYWVSSYNGATNISIKTNDKTTNEFFEHNFYAGMHNVYFILFLAVLHQKYTLLKLMWEMGELDRLENDFRIMKEQLDKTKIYQTEAAYLRFRDFFKFPSYIQHINEYYDLLYRTLNIEELYKDFSQDLKNIEDICKLYIEKITNHQMAKNKLKKAIVKAATTLLTAFLGFTTLLNESWSFVEKAYGIPAGTISIPVVFVTIVLAIPSVVGITEAIENVQVLRMQERIAKNENPEMVKKTKKDRK